MLKKSLLQQFKTNSNERASFLGLMIILLISFGLGFLMNNNQPSKETSYNTLDEIFEKYGDFAVKDLAKPKVNTYEKPNYLAKKTTPKKKKFIDESITPPSLFTFDPNTATLDELKRLGISEGRAKVLINFRKSGFKFKNPEDLLKVRYFSEQDYNRLKDYVNFPKIINKKSSAAPSQLRNKTIAKLPKETNKQTNFIRKSKVLENKIEINSATKQELQTIYGIGDFYASQIIKYRKRLGGFVTIGQLKEAHDFPDSTLNFLAQNININQAMVQKININAVSFRDIMKHPYIDFEQNKILYPFIEQRLPIENLEILYEMHVLDSLYITKLIPYFEL